MRWLRAFPLASAILLSGAAAAPQIVPASPERQCEAKSNLVQWCYYSDIDRRCECKDDDGSTVSVERWIILTGGKGGWSHHEIDLESRMTRFSSSADGELDTDAIREKKALDLQLPGTILQRKEFRFSRSGRSVR